MKPTYLICHRHRQHIILFSARDLVEAARCLVAQPNGAELLVYASEGGFSRELTATECESLSEYMATASA